jgi:hypothetical protein
MGRRGRQTSCELDAHASLESDRDRVPAGNSSCPSQPTDESDRVCSSYPAETLKTPGRGPRVPPHTTMRACSTVSCRRRGAVLERFGDAARRTVVAQEQVPAPSRLHRNRAPAARPAREDNTAAHIPMETPRAKGSLQIETEQSSSAGDERSFPRISTGHGRPWMTWQELHRERLDGAVRAQLLELARKVRQPW